MTNPTRSDEVLNAELSDVRALIEALGGYNRAPEGLLLPFADLRVEWHKQTGVSE